MLEIFKLIRLRTIAFAAFTMYAMRYFVIVPILARGGFSLQLSDGDFSFLVVSVCCLVSAAYVINDYFDTKTDRLSGNREIIVGKTISRRMAIILHTFLNIVAVVIAFYMGERVGHWEFGILFLAVSLLLWFYSSRYKKRFVWGNLFVAFLAGCIPLSAVLFEIPLLTHTYSDVIAKTGINFNAVLYWTGWFSYFLFFNMWIYEVNKDIYSIEGDRDDGVMTFPVKLGIRKTKIFISILVCWCIVSMFVLYAIEFSHSWVVLGYFAVGLFIPYLFYVYSVLRDDRKKFQFYLIRLIMVLCVGFSLLLQYFFNSVA